MVKIAVEVCWPNRPSESKEFEQEQVIVGREAGDIVLEDPQCSTRHAQLDVGAGGVILSDLESTNGTFFADGTRISLPVPLAVGTEFRIGDCRVILTSFEGSDAYSARGTLVIAASQEDDSGAQEPLPKVPSLTPPAPRTPPPGATLPQAAGAKRLTIELADVPAPNVPPPSIRPSTGPDVPPPNVPMSQRVASIPPSSRWSKAPAPVLETGARRPRVFGFTKQIVTEFRPQATEAIKAIAMLVLPAHAFAAGLGLLPEVGMALQTTVFILLGAGLGFFGVGLTGEAALRIAAKQPVVATELWTTQLQRMVPWFLGIMVPMVITLIATACGVLPGILLGHFVLPVYMLEERVDFEVNKRSLELLRTNWVLGLGTLFATLVPVLTLSALVGAVLSLVPVVGGVLSILWWGFAISVAMSLGAFVSVRTYLELRHTAEGVDPVQALVAAAE